MKMNFLRCFLSWVYKQFPSCITNTLSIEDLKWHGHPKAQIFFDISGQKFHFSLKCAELVRAKMITAKKSSNKTNSHCRIVRPKSVMSRTKTKTDLRYPKRQRNVDLLSSPSIFCYASIISQSETFYLSLTRKGGQRRFDLSIVEYCGNHCVLYNLACQASKFQSELFALLWTLSLTN